MCYYWPRQTVSRRSLQVSSFNVFDFEEIKPQLLKVFQIKLWPAGHLPFFRAKVEKACRRIEARHSQTSLKTDIAERCRVVNDKKAALDAKTDTSAST
jgi:hypothetical protein